MAKNKNSGTNGETQAADDIDGAAAPSRFREIATDSYMFNAEKCYAELAPKDKLPLVGYLLGMRDMPPIKGRAWKALVLQTTEPVHVIDREKNILLAPPGSMVLTPATWQIEQSLAKAALNPLNVYEVSIAPKKKIEIGGGQSMWTYTVGANPKALSRRNFGVAALLENANTPPALPQSTGEDDVAAPF